jgi:two-component system chemotaxis response regulator CheY
MPRILIVDDHAAVRKSLRLLFDVNGFEVCGEAVNGYDAIEKAQVLRPDLILLDLCMPVMNGLDAARQLTKLMPKVPLIMFTNQISEIMEEEAREVGIRSIISKNESYKKLINHALDVLGLGEF